MTLEHNTSLFVINISSKKIITCWFKEKSNALRDTATEHSKCVFIGCVREDNHHHEYSP